MCPKVRTWSDVRSGRRSGVRPYAYAELGGRDLGVVRVAGPGLGNMLFPWARFVLGVRRYGLQPVAPTWRQLKVGPLLRGERDLRSYSRLFQSVPDYLTGVARLRILATAARLEEPAEEPAANLDPRGVVIYRGVRDYFVPLSGHHALLRREFARAVRREIKRSIPCGPCQAIAIHVRLGDFAPPDVAGSHRESDANVRMPLQWYVDTLRQIRGHLGGSLAANVFSDGRLHELAPVLQEPSCRRVCYGSSVADMLAMSQHACLVASNSSFSMWACFLGQVPVIRPSSEMEGRLIAREGGEATVPPGAEVPRAWIESVRKHCERRVSWLDQ